MDESALYYRVLPTRSIRKQTNAGRKKDKTRITITLTANTEGSEKLLPFSVGHALRPRCFGKVSVVDHGFQYRNNKNAWMTGGIVS